MELAAMVRCAHALVRAMKEDLAKTRTVEPVFVLLQKNACDFVAYDPLLLQSPPGRTAIADNLRQRAIQTGAAAVLIGMDSYAFVPDLEAIATANERLVQAATTAGIDALVRSGFGRKSEAISVSLQTSAFHVLLQQLYTRGNSNSIVFGELRRVDSREYGNTPVISTGLLNVFSLGRAGRA